MSAARIGQFRIDEDERGSSAVGEVAMIMILLTLAAGVLSLVAGRPEPFLGGVFATILAVAVTAWSER